MANITLTLNVYITYFYKPRDLTLNDKWTLTLTLPRYFKKLPKVFKFILIERLGKIYQQSFLELGNTYA
jgi:hypothetical protein